MTPAPLPGGGPCLVPDPVAENETQKKRKRRKSFFPLASREQQQKPKSLTSQYNAQLSRCGCSSDRHQLSLSATAPATARASRAEGPRRDKQRAERCSCEQFPQLSRARTQRPPALTRRK